VLANDVHYPLDYGTVMPMVCYLDPTQKLPMVPVSVCLAADLEESYQWGRYIAEVARESGKRVGFVASGSVSHKLVRGPEKGPHPEDEALDHRFAKLLASGEYENLWDWLPEFARTTQAEMGGRHLAMLLGAVRESGQRFTASVHAYGPSSGSGNYVISLLAAS
jgi:3,4-dihydroxyphenylacetate 2,3-dioxygenase